MATDHTACIVAMGGITINLLVVHWKSRSLLGELR